MTVVFSCLLSKQAVSISFCIPLNTHISIVYETTIQPWKEVLVDLRVGLDIARLVLRCRWPGRYGFQVFVWLNKKNLFFKFFHVFSMVNCGFGWIWISFRTSNFMWVPSVCLTSNVSHCDSQVVCSLGLDITGHQWNKNIGVKGGCEL